MTLIVLEGADGTGKTTLAERFAARLPDCHYLHRGVPERHPLEEYESDLDWYVPGSHNVVCDRWHLGEIVYGLMYRGHSVLGGNVGPGRFHVDAYLRSRGAILLLTDCSKPTARHRLEQRGDEDYLDLDDLDECLTRFRTACDFTTALPARRVATEGWVGEDEISRILRLAVDHGAYASRLNSWPNYVGPTLPTYLIVGEQRGNAHPGGPRVAFAPYRNTSGWWLLSSLPVGVLPHVGFVNALECADLFQLWNTLGRPHVATLGRVADEAADAWKIPHGAVPHPQYVRRFHHESLGSYGNVLVERALKMGERRLHWRP